MNNESYSKRDHRHCFTEENPPCGLKGKHRCCLCGEERKEKEEREKVLSDKICPKCDNFLEFWVSDDYYFKGKKFFSCPVCFWEPMDMDVKGQEEVCVCINCSGDNKECKIHAK